MMRSAPPRIREWVATTRLRKTRQRNGARPIGEVFSEVYECGRWGAGEDFDSGSGSRGQPADRYAAYIRELIRETGARKAVDIGCGDFRVASRFADSLASYLGVDVVNDVISRNMSMYGRSGVSFSVLDAADSELPAADICLIRQVLQHLSNLQIAEILNRCHSYRLVVVTEHWPAPGAARKPNIDKPHGPDTRLDRGSWVDIERAPFDCAPVDEVLRVRVDAPLYRVGETIRTQLWRPPCDT
jgi:hypothetical protein